MVSALAFAACAPRTLPTRICTTLGDCNAGDGEKIAVVGLYRQHPDLPGFDYSEAPRAVRIELDDGPGPFLDPFWSKRAIRPQTEIDQYIGRRVQVIGLYHKLMPRNPEDPPQASAVGGPCIEVESIKLAP